MRLFVAALLIIASLAAAQEGGYQEASSTRCWDCHAPGKWNPAMRPAFAVDPGAAVFGSETLLEPRIVNTWRGELSQMTLEIDISAAPGMAFIGGEAPYHNETRGKLTFDHTDPSMVNRAHTTQVEITVPSGASALRISLSPDDVGPLGPDLSMAVVDAVSNDAFTTIDDQGAGGDETLSLQDAATIAAHGSGIWVIEAGARLAGTDGHLDPQVNDVGFHVSVDAWFNTSLERTVVLEAPGPLQPGVAQPFTLPVSAADVAPGEAITFTARARLFYEHGNDYPDEAFIVYTETFIVGADESGAPMLGVQSFVVPVPTEGLGLAAVSEIIGYAAAFLMVASLLSGGILGKRSRRAMNRLFVTARRRVAFHNFLSYGIIAAAIGHLVLFVIEIQWHWAWGLLWGGLGILSLFALGFTGALQVQIIRRLGFRSWRWIHFGVAIAAVVFTVIHVLLDGSHFEVRDAIGWTDPLVPDARQ